MTSNGCPTNARNEIIFIRQESKVQKIEQDDEHDPFLQKNTAETKCISEKRRPPNLKTTFSKDEEDNEINNTKELKVNGNVVIYMPSKEEPCVDNIKYKDESGKVTPFSFDEHDGPKFPNTKSEKKRFSLFQLFYKKQTYINIALGIACGVAMLLAILTYLKSSSATDRHLYCYPCDSVSNIKEKYREEDMCCISEPLKNFQDKSSQTRPEMDDESLTYNGSRIVEFEADFQREWTTTDKKSYNVWWSPSGSINNSFVSYRSDAGLFSLTHTATYVITVSLTTDTYSTNTNEPYIRLMVCLVFENSKGTKTDECRPITHTKIMNIPFQIVKYCELKSETHIYVTITSQKFLPRGYHNKLYIVML